ncbi:hypothetical protein CLOM_g14267 [Closterium sp. NIES-68]|nr:hypothetical protein CLOM_g12911 [Closterium sp. NIES-68]GJP55290.1 hypothetical protein CLOM_g14267 [Closterium sp. NIES-68]GJP79478.1 hypothetical protein CLOP_g9710 [Closterium sp. NIES-67]GJP83167.1 hypothetical protein CLOP_g13361 [Closterium sp. NIES-67]
MWHDCIGAKFEPPLVTSTSGRSTSRVLDSPPLLQHQQAKPLLQGRARREGQDGEGREGEAREGRRQELWAGSREDIGSRLVK